MNRQESAVSTSSEIDLRWCPSCPNRRVQPRSGPSRCIPEVTRPGPARPLDAHPKLRTARRSVHVLSSSPRISSRHLAPGRLPPARCGENAPGCSRPTGGSGKQRAGEATVHHEQSAPCTPLRRGEAVQRSTPPVPASRPAVPLHCPSHLLTEKEGACDSRSSNCSSTSIAAGFGSG